MKNCSNENCKQVNPQSLEEFKLRKDGKPVSWCRSCDHSAVRSWRKANPDNLRGSNLKRYWPELSGKESLEKYNTLFKSQDGKCNICQKHQSELKYSLCVDHCHKTDKIRGLLCDNCNQALGLLKDDIESLKRAIKHVE